MKTIARDQILLMILPAAIIVLFYMALPYMGSLGQTANPSTQLGKLTEDLKKTRKQAPPPTTVTFMKSTVTATQKQVSELRQQKQNLEKQWRTLQNLYSNGPSWPEETKVSIQQVLKEQGLYVTSVTGSKISIPSSLQKVFSGLNSGKSGLKDRQIVAFHFVGRYSDVLRSLNALVESDLRVIPVSLVMKEANLDTEYREWELAIWI